MDGLLIDSERIFMKACVSAANAQGIALTEAEYVTVVGRAAPDATRLLTELLGGRENFINIMQRLNAMLDDSDTLFPLKSGALQTLQMLRDMGIPCAVASSSARHEIQHRLGGVDVLKYFDAISGGDEVRHGKPNPAMYELAMQRLGVSADQCFAFEDSENGALAAFAAGLRVVVIPDLKMPGEFVQANCHSILPSLEVVAQKLPQWLCLADATNIHAQ